MMIAYQSLSTTLMSIFKRKIIAFRHANHLKWSHVDDFDGWYWNSSNIFNLICHAITFNLGPESHSASIPFQRNFHFEFCDLFLSARANTYAANDLKIEVWPKWRRAKKVMWLFLQIDYVRMDEWNEENEDEIKRLCSLCNWETRSKIEFKWKFWVAARN